MNKIIYIVMLCVTLSFFSGCSGVDLSQVSDEDLQRISDKAVVCNEPYIRIGIECCMDKNNNNICDRDEQNDSNLQNDVIEEEEPFFVPTLERLETDRVYIKNTNVDDLDVKIKVFENGEAVCQDNQVYRLDASSVTEVELGCSFEPGKSLDVVLMMDKGVVSSTMLVRGEVSNVSDELDAEKQSQEKITTNIEVVQVYVTGTDDGRIDAGDLVSMVLRLEPQSGPVNLDDLQIKLDTSSGSQMVTDYDENDKFSYTKFAIDYISNAGLALHDGYIVEDDLVRLYFKYGIPESVGEAETATIRLLMGNGAVKPVDLTTPSIMSEETTYLYSLETHSEEKITTDIEVVQVYISGTSNGAIDFGQDSISLLVRLGSDSAVVNLNDLIIKLDTMSGSQTLSYNDNINSTDVFNARYISGNNNAVQEGFLSVGDLVEFTFVYGIEESVGGGESMTLRLLMANGAIKPVDLTTPYYMSSEVTYVFP